MRRDPGPIGPSRGNDHPTRNSRRLPAAFLGDLAGEPPLPVERSHQLVDVGDVRLQLDDQERSPARMPGDDVDDAPLAVDRERDFRRELPGRQRVPEPGGDRVMERRVAGVEQRSRSPARHRGEEVDSNIERGRDGSHGAKRQGVEVTSFEARDRGIGNAGPRRQVPLTPAATVADRPDRRAETSIVHLASCPMVSLPALLTPDLPWQDRHPADAYGRCPRRSGARSADSARNRLPMTMLPFGLQRPATSHSRLSMTILPARGDPRQPRARGGADPRQPRRAAPRSGARSRHGPGSRHQTERPFVLVSCAQPATARGQGTHRHVDNPSPERGQPAPSVDEHENRPNHHI